MANNNRLGELLVREKLISLAQLRHAQEEQQKSGHNLGYTLAKLGYTDLISMDLLGFGPVDFEKLIFDSL